LPTQNIQLKQRKTAQNGTNTANDARASDLINAKRNSVKVNRDNDTLLATRCKCGIQTRDPIIFGAQYLRNGAR